MPLQAPPDAPPHNWPCFGQDESVGPHALILAHVLYLCVLGAMHMMQNLCVCVCLYPA